jgi:alanyl-tRNA synthetase
VQATGRELAEAMGGRGGGSGRIFQGKATSLTGRQAALERLASIVGGR